MSPVHEVKKQRRSIDGEPCTPGLKRKARQLYKALHDYVVCIYFAYFLMLNY